VSEKIKTHNPNQTIRLIQAAGRGDLELVKHTLENNAELNGREAKTGNTALISAAMKGRKDVMAFLLSEGADDRITNKKGENAANALMCAVATGEIKTEDFLIIEKEHLISHMLRTME
jgi:uncharacterized protein